MFLSLCLLSLSSDLILATSFCLSLLSSSVTGCLLGSQDQLFKQNHSSPLLMPLFSSRGQGRMKGGVPSTCQGNPDPHEEVSTSKDWRGNPCQYFPCQTQLSNILPWTWLPSTLLYALVFITILLLLNPFLFQVQSILPIVLGVEKGHL